MLATVSRNGAPLVAPVDGLLFRGRLPFSSSPTCVRFRDIRRDPRLSANYNRGEIVHRDVREIDRRASSSLGLRNYDREVHGASGDSCGCWGKAPYAVIAPRRTNPALMDRAILEARSARASG